MTRLLLPGDVHEEETEVDGVRVQASSQPPLQAFLETPQQADRLKPCASGALMPPHNHSRLVPSLFTHDGTCTDALMPSACAAPPNRLSLSALRSDRRADQAIGIIDRRADQIDR